jgi:hypothetical protein
MPHPGGARARGRRDDPGVGLPWRRVPRRAPWILLGRTRRQKIKAPVRPLVIVVPQVLVEDPLKVASAPDQQPVQALLPHRPHPPLRVGVGVRRLDRCLDDLGPIGDEDVVEGAGELAVAVAYQEPRGGDVPRPFHLDRELSCPLDHPRPTRMVSDPTKSNSPGPKLDEEQDVEGLEPHGFHGEEVCGDDDGGLRPKERPPGGRGPSGRGPKPMAQQHPCGWWWPTPRLPAS